MRVNNFELKVIGGNELGTGHVAMRHDNVFTLSMINHFMDRRCDAQVSVDGKDCGSFRINVGCTISLERPINDTGKFTFYEAGSNEAALAGEAKLDTDTKGLIQVTFTPEHPAKVRTISTKKCVTENTTTDFDSDSGGNTTTDFDSGESTSYRSAGGASGQSCNTKGFAFRGQHTNCSSARHLSAGMTGLSGKSNQSFITVADLNYDEANKVVISLRLVTDNSPRELKPVTRGNAVPASVE